MDTPVFLRRIGQVFRFSQLLIGRAKIKRLEIGELRVTRLHVTESLSTPNQ
jgi:hypothetical protein